MIFIFLLSFILISFSYLSYRNQKLGITVLFALLPTYLVRLNIGPIPTTLLECLVLITIGIGILRCTSETFQRTISTVWKSFGWYRIPLILLFVASIISTIIAPNLFSALGILKAYIIEPVLLAFVIKSAMTDRKDIENVITVLIGSGTFIGLLAILQVMTHMGIPDSWAIESRATSLYDYPNAVGLLLAPIVAMAFVRLATSAEKWGSSALLVIGIIIMLGGIVAAKTEAALLAIPISLLAIAFIAPIKNRVKIAILIMSTLAVFTIGAIVPSILQKIALHDSSGLVRRAQWSETLTMLADSPFLGVGLNGYSTALIPYHDATFYEIFQYPHNILLNIWSELGIFGVLAFTVGIILVARTTWRRRDDALILAFSAALLSMLIHGLVDVPFFKNDLAILTVFCMVGMMTRKQSSDPRLPCRTNTFSSQ